MAAHGISRGSGHPDGMKKDDKDNVW